jgi:methionine synthase I (cobalamin-dependent)
MREPILDRLARGEVLIADGATGTMLQAAGLPAGVPGEAWVLEKPSAILALHRAYLEAGSQLILTTTFGGTRVRLRAAGLEAQTAVVNRRAAELAREAAGDGVYVAGDLGPSGEMMAPLGRLSHEAAADLFAEQAEALAAGGVDVLYVETMSDLKEARAAVEGARRACSLPVFCTFSFDSHGRTNMGVSPLQAAQGLAELEVQAVGANCGHAPEEVLAFLPVMREAAPKAVLIAKPNAGVPRLVKRQPVFDATPERMGELALQFVGLGAQIVGGCCGSSPAHIAAIAQAIGDQSARPAPAQQMQGGGKDRQP